MSKLWGWLLAAGAFALTLLAAIAGAKREGRKDERLKQIEKATRQARQGNEIDNTVRDATDADLDKRLSKYRRD